MKRIEGQELAHKALETCFFLKPTGLKLPTSPGRAQCVNQRSSSFLSRRKQQAFERFYTLYVAHSGSTVQGLQGPHSNPMAKPWAFSGIAPAHFASIHPKSLDTALCFFWLPPFIPKSPRKTGDPEIFM